MRLRWGPRRRSPRLLALGGGPDLISALPDHLLLLVLARLPCAGAAARTGVLSRRWRGLWARLRRIVFRDVPFHSLEPALARVPPPPPTVSLLEIRLPKPRGRVPEEQLVDTARLKSLLRAAAWLQPEEFLLVFPSGIVHDRAILDQPSFHRATSIVLDLYSYGDHPSSRRRLPAGVEFPALETLSISGCVADFDALLSRCPRLRTLRLHGVYLDKSVLRVNSPLLQELVVSGAPWIKQISIAAPVLTQLTMSLHTYQEISISIVAPMVEKVSWKCYFSRESGAFGLWRLNQLNLQAAAESQGQLPSLHIHAFTRSYTFHESEEVANFTQQIEKRLIAAFSVLELHLQTEGHVYGAFVFHVLETDRIRCAIQRLKVNLLPPFRENLIRLVMEEEEGCPPHCPCPCEPTDWKSQTISLTALEEVQINGFDGNDHDFDFLKLILSCAPMLKRITMKLSQEALASNAECTKLYNIFKAYSSVQCYVYLSSGLMHGSRNCPST